MGAPIALCVTTAMVGMNATITIAGSTMSGVLQDARIMMERKNSCPPPSGRCAYSRHRRQPRLRGETRSHTELALGKS